MCLQKIYIHAKHIEKGKISNIFKKKYATESKKFQNNDLENQKSA